MVKRDKCLNRQIAIFTDIHALLEPTIAILEDIKKRGIKEIYSLGDNIGVGPNPSEVLDLLNENNVISIAGNNEEYMILGTEPFSYFTDKKKNSYLWSKSKLTLNQIDSLKSYSHSIDLVIGNKKIALCHFANDVRCDFTKHSTWTYQSAINEHNPSKQFLYTNSQDQKKKINHIIKKYGHSKENLGYLSTLKDPLFKGKQVSEYDAIIQGHVHFKMFSETETTKFYSIRAAGMAYGKDPADLASYIILKEKIDGYEIEEVLVSYDRNKMIQNILNSDMPDNESISKFTSIKR